MSKNLRVSEWTFLFDCRFLMLCNLLSEIIIFFFRFYFTFFFRSPISLFFFRSPILLLPPPPFYYYYPLLLVLIRYSHKYNFPTWFTNRVPYFCLTFTTYFLALLPNSDTLKSYDSNFFFQDFRRSLFLVECKFPSPWSYNCPKSQWCTFRFTVISLWNLDGFFFINVGTQDMDPFDSKFIFLPYQYKSL